MDQIKAEWFLFHIMYVTQLFFLGHMTHFVKVRGPQWQCVHIAQHMKSGVWFEVNRLPWNNTVTYVKGYSSVT